MGSLLIEYRYDGNEDNWRESIENFLNQISADPKLSGRFRYSVFIGEDGVSRSHVPSWDCEETLSYLQSQDFFKAFAAKVKEFAGDSLRTNKSKMMTKS